MDTSLVWVANKDEKPKERAQEDIILLVVQHVLDEATKRKGSAELHVDTKNNVECTTEYMRELVSQLLVCAYIFVGILSYILRTHIYINTGRTPTTLSQLFKTISTCREHWRLYHTLYSWICQNFGVFKGEST